MRITVPSICTVQRGLPVRSAVLPSSLRLCSPAGVPAPHNQPADRAGSAPFPRLSLPIRVPEFPPHSALLASFDSAGAEPRLDSITSPHDCTEDRASFSTAPPKDAARAPLSSVAALPVPADAGRHLVRDASENRGPLAQARPVLLVAAG